MVYNAKAALKHIRILADGDTIDFTELDAINYIKYHASITSILFAHGMTTEEVIEKVYRVRKYADMANPKSFPSIFNYPN